MGSTNFYRLSLLVLTASACIAVPVARTTPAAPPAPPVPQSLGAPEDFASIQDVSMRSQAMFVEAGKVLTHARCLNCHPASDSPSQGTPGKLHNPPVTRGVDGHGVFALGCSACHQDHNLDAEARVPGAPAWHLAPRSMAWQGLTLPALCMQLKDKAKNGNRNLSQIVSHSAADALVGWAWAPGADRMPAPGTQERFGALMAAWAATGGVCPSEK